MTYPTISHFIEDITGFFIPLPIQTFGLFIVLAFLAAHYFIKKEFLRLEAIGILKETPNKDYNTLNIVEYVFNGLISFLFGYKIIYILKNYKLFAESPQEYLLSTNGNIIMGIIFLIISIIQIYNTNKRKDQSQSVPVLPSQLSWNFIFIAGLSGIVGAKLFAVFEDVNHLITDPLGALFSFSGLTFYGGLIFGTISVIIYAKKHKINIPDIADIFAPSLILGYGIGRLGCHFSGDGDWGIISNTRR